MSFGVNLKILFLTAIILLLTGFTIVEGKIIYVDDDANGLNDGSSWDNAYRYLQDALVDANSSAKPIEIHVAQGIYKPDEGGGVTLGDKWVTFQLISGVTLRGGYAGLGEPDPNTRDVEVYQTILSGDLDGNDVSRDLTFETPHEVWQSYADNSQCVVDGSSADSSAVLDGFMIMAGYRVPSSVPDRDGTSPDSIGGGMRNISGSPTIINCTFEGNSGAVFNVANSSPAFLDCRFVRNLAGEGGAMVNWESNPEIQGCVFEDNSALGDGGAICFRGGSALIMTCRFSCNQAHHTGGAINNIGANIKLTDCELDRNQAGGDIGQGAGGAMFTSGDSNTVIEECTFFRNESLAIGGCIYAEEGHLTLFKCVFNSNSTNGMGGSLALGIYANVSINKTTFESNRANLGSAVFNMTEALKMERCIMVGNWAVNTGSAVYGSEKGLLQMNNCTLSGNLSDQGTSVAGLNSVIVRDSIVWDQSAFVMGDKINITYSNVQGSWSELGEGNITADPCFAEPGYWDPNGTIEDPNDDFWIDGDYHLKSQAGRWDPNNQSWVKDDVTSPCIDSGDPNSPVGFEPFPNGGIINMGAYGGTAEASKSYFGEPVCETIIAGDINGDCKVDFKDFQLIALHWLK
jgi:predicted outer membrane repeat protein